MPPKPSSIRAYLEHVKSGKCTTQRERVMFCILTHAPVSREQIEKITGIKLSSVCPRVHSLMYPDPDDPSVLGPVKIAYHSEVRRIEYLEARWVRLEDEKPKQIKFEL